MIINISNYFNNSPNRVFIIVIPTILNSFTESTVKQFFEPRQIYKPDFYSTFKEIEKSNNKNFLFSLKERDSKVSASILDALDNFVIAWIFTGGWKMGGVLLLPSRLLQKCFFIIL